MADQGDVEPGGFEGLEIGGGLDAGFCDEIDVRGDEGFEVDGMVEIGGHCGEIAVIDAQEDAV